MDKLLAKWNEFVTCYVNNKNVHSTNEELHMKHLDIVLEKFKAHGIKLNKQKCSFLRKEIQILGFVVKKGEMKPDPD